MAWPGYELKDVPAQCMSNTPCQTGIVCETASPHVFRFIISDIGMFGYIDVN
jgi:hypothetical protein